MSSTEITTREHASDKPRFPLSVELRLKIYELLLIHPHRSLKPNGFLCYTEGRPYREKDYIFTSILRTCRMFYEEALAILYGKNVLAFHDNEFNKPVLPFPEKHLTMVKHVEVDISPFIYSSAKRMWELLMTLGTSGAKLFHLSIRIHKVEGHDEFLRTTHHALPPLHLYDQFLLRDHPIVTGLFSFTTVRNLYIGLEDEARFEPGVANALRGWFMEQGTIDARSIKIEKQCSFPHYELEEDQLCPSCWFTGDECKNDVSKWEDVDDENMERECLAFELSGHRLIGAEMIKAKAIKAIKAKMKAMKAPPRTMVTRSQAKKVIMEKT